MRAIETKIIDWVKTHESGEFRPSMRDYVKGTGNGKYFFRLWDSLIFVKTANAVFFSFCGYPTLTTKNRINAYLRAFGSGGVYQKNYTMYWTMSYENFELDSSKIYMLTNGNIKQIDFDEFYKLIG